MKKQIRIKKQIKKFDDLQKDILSHEQIGNEEMNDIEDSEEINELFDVRKNI